jgi:MFS family permease
MIPKNLQYYKFCAYGFLKNLRFFDPFIILFFRETGLSYLQIGVLFSVREISNALLEIPTGVIADWFGRKNAMIFSFICYIFSFIIFYLFPDYILFLIAMIFFSGGEAFRSGTHKAMILDYLKLNNLSNIKTAYYGHTRSWSQKGSAISSLLAALLVFYTGKYRIIFLASTIPYVLELILMISYPNELNGSLQDSGLKKPRSVSFNSILKIFNNSQFRKGILNSAIFDGLFKSIKDYLQPILYSLALSIPIFVSFSNNRRSALIIGIIYFLIYLMTSAASKYSFKTTGKSQNLKKVINVSFIGGVLVVIASGIFYENEMFVLSSLLFIIIFIIQNIRRPLNVSYISDTISGELMATGLSIETQMKNVSIAILSPILGLLADIFGVGYAISITALVILLVYPLLKVKKVLSQ